MKSGWYIVGDYSMFRGDAWIACRKTEAAAIRFANNFVRKHPHASAYVRRLSGVKKIIRENDIPFSRFTKYY